MGFNIKNNYGPNIEVNDGGRLTLVLGKDGLWHTVEAEDHETPAAIKPAAKPKAQPQTAETFADRVKAIMRKAAEKNGQRIESHARGNTGTYIYNVDADAFCLAMDKMVSMHGGKLRAFLGGTMENVQVTKVCFFIGQIISRQIINDSQLQMADMLFAFEKYYKLSTVKSRLSTKRCTSEENLLFGTFEGLLRTCKS